MGFRNDTTIEEELSGNTLLYSENSFSNNYIDIYYHSHYKNRVLSIYKINDFIDLYILMYHLRKNIINVKEKINFFGKMINVNKRKLSNGLLDSSEEDNYIEQGSFKISSENKLIHIYYKGKLIVGPICFHWVNGLIDSILSNKTLFEKIKPFLEIFNNEDKVLKEHKSILKSYFDKMMENDIINISDNQILNVSNILYKYKIIQKKDLENMIETLHRHKYENKSFIIKKAKINKTEPLLIVGDNIKVRYFNTKKTYNFYLNNKLITKRDSYF